MSNTSIQLKKSGATGNTPESTDLSYGEVALNYADGKLYYKNAIDDISFITNQDSFATVSVNGSLILATSPTDILTLNAGNNISLIGNTTTKTITISATGTGAGVIDTFARDTANAAFLEANAAYLEANSAYTLAQNAFNKANTFNTGSGGLTIIDLGYVYEAVNLVILDFGLIT
jgi:hypothetical protein